MSSDLKSHVTLIFGLAVVVSVVVFTLTVALRHINAVNRIWASGFFAAFASWIFSILWGSGDSPPVETTVAASVCAVYAVGALWSGARAFNERPSRVHIVVAVTVLAGVVTFIGGLRDGPPAESFLAYLLAGGFAFLSIVELRSRPIGRNLNSVILQYALGIFGAAHVVAGCLLSVIDRADDTMKALEPDNFAFLLAGLFFIAAICLSALRAERHGSWRSEDSPVEELYSDLGTLHSTHFENAANDRLDRAATRGRQVSLIIAQIDNLTAFNTAFGRDAGDEILVRFAFVLRESVPVSAILGYLGAGCFGALIVSGSRDEADEIIDGLAANLRNTPTIQSTGIRLGAEFGRANTRDGMATYRELFTAATAALERSATLSEN